LVYSTNYETGDVYLPGDQWTVDDPLMLNTLVGIGHVRIVGAAEPPIEPTDPTRRRRGRPPTINPRPPHLGGGLPDTPGRPHVDPHHR
jgi:hypothetical protein